jgi:hypothetical protein
MLEVEQVRAGGGAMQFEIDGGDAVVLRDVLTAWLGEISSEIRHTDNPGVRERLRSRRDSMRRVLDELGSQEEPAAS